MFKTKTKLGTKAMSIFLSLLMAASMLTVLMSIQPTEEVSAANSYGLAENIQDGAILHCFDWKYSDIKNMLPEIAQSGFCAVQTSPAQPANSGEWWWLYQPKGFYVSTNSLGTKDELKALCSEAENYGIKVVVDVVANHLAGDHSDIQNDLKDSQYWHHESGGIDYNNRWQIHQREIGMPDINSEHSYVQQVVKGYIQELESIGVDGIRWDAAKHIGLPSENCQFWSTVTSGTNLWHYGEILDDPVANNETAANSLMKEYSNYISVTDSGYCGNIRMAFRSGTVFNSIGNYSERGVAKNKLVYWGESHDTYSNDNADGRWDSSQFISQNKIDRAYAVVAAQGKSAALYFSRPSQTSKNSIKSGEKGSTHFTSKEVAEVNKFKNAMIGQTEYDLTNSNCSIICREKGAVIVAGSGENFSVSVPNGGGTVAPGTYTDQVSGNTWTVTSSTISGTIGSTGIAVVYNPDDTPTPSGSVSASPATGTTFTDTLSVTLNAKNVTNAQYSTSEGASGSYTNGQTIVVGSSTSVGSSVTVTLTGTKSDGSTATATYTYKKTEPKTYPTLSGGGFVFDNSTKNWSTVYAYVYDESGSSVVENASWPGVKMTDCGNGYWKYELDSKFSSSSNIRVIFNNTSEQIPASQEPGFKMTGTDQKLYENSTWQDLPASSSLSITSFTASPTSVQANNPVTLTAAVSGNTGSVTYKFATSTETIASSSSNSCTWTPTAAGTYTITVTATDSSTGKTATKTTTVTVTAATTKDPTVTVNKPSGTEFTTETLDITLSLANAVSGTYSVDDGPTKTFTSAATVTIGEGKIADSTVTVKATATSSSGTTKSYTFTYNKKYVKKTSNSTASVSAVATASTTSSSSLSSYYATNPNNQLGGQNKTITSASDFTDSMIIAQGVANDDPRIFRGSHEAPVYDTYALYGAWDSTNLYLGWQFTNVTDVVDPAQGYPTSDNGKPWNGDIPQMLAFDLGTGNSADMSSGTLSGGGYVWGLKVGFETDIDALMCFSSKPGVGQPALFKTGSDGYFNYEDITSFKDGGISFTYEDGFFGSSIMGIKDNGYAGYVPSDLESDSSNWVNFLNEGHSTTHDTFYIMTIPLATLGVTKDYIESNGIGVMHVSTFGEGGIASIPMDMTMLDNATVAYSQDDSTSAEKEDTDTVSVPLARIGSGATTPPVTTPLQVNFGTDRSAPQLTTTSLTLSAVGYGGTAPYKYQFYVDGTTVKSNSTTDSCTWTPSTSGSHTLKCVITDSTGATATVTKTFTAETAGGDVTELVNNSTISATSITKGSSITMTGKATGGTTPYTYTYFCKSPSSSSYTTLKTTTATTYTHTPANTGTYSYAVKVVDADGNKQVKYFSVTVSSTTTALTNSSTISATSITKGSSIKLTAKATGGTSPYKYRYFCKPAGDTSYTALTGTTTATTYTHTPSRAISYSYAVKIADSTGKTATKYFTVKVTSALANSSTISATSITKGASIKLTAKATGGTSPYKYRYFCKPQGDIGWTALTSTTTATTYKHTPARAISYQYAVKVADSTGKVITKYFTVNVSSNKALANASTISATSITKGNSITLTAKATGGTSPYKYRYFCMPEGADSWTALTSTTTATTYKHTPARAISYKYAVKVADSTGKVITKYFTVNVSSNTALANASTISATSITKGTKLTLTAKATGGTSPYKYRYFCKPEGDSDWTALTETTTATTYKHTPARSISYQYAVKVADSTGKVITKYFTVTVK